MRIRWTERARRQLVEAIVDFDEQRPGTGVKFHEAVRGIIDILRAHPLSFAQVFGVRDMVARRALVTGFDHWLIYKVDSTRREVIVLATWHTKRRPSGWMRS